MTKHTPRPATEVILVRLDEIPLPARCRPADSRKMTTHTGSIRAIDLAYREYLAGLKRGESAGQGSMTPEGRQLWSAFGEAQACAVKAFADLNGWTKRREPWCGSVLDGLGRGFTFGGGRPGYPHSTDYSHFDQAILDHPIWFSAGQRYVAAVGQPYQVQGNDLAVLKFSLKARGIAMHTPADPCASIHYPGSTLFLVFTKPGTSVRFLPDQDGSWRSVRAPKKDAAGNFPYLRP